MGATPLPHTHTRAHLLTVLRVVPAAAVAANVLDFLADLTVDGERHAVVVVVLQILAGALLVVTQRHDSDQAERLLRLGLLHGHGRVLSAARGGEPGAVDDGGRRIHGRVVHRLEHSKG